MAKKKSDFEDLYDEESLDDISDLLGIGDTADDNSKEPLPAPEPFMTDPEWQDFVLGKFTPEERDDNGNPYVAGLRRVARLLLGPIVESRAHVVQAPTFVNPESLRLVPATVEYTVVFHWVRDTFGTAAYRATFTDVSDVYSGNTEMAFCVHASSTAATRAEGRCLRKALMLQRVIAAEEDSKTDPENSGADGMITKSQINFLDITCSRLDIDVIAYINSGKTKYNNVNEISGATANRMNKHLSGLQNSEEQKNEFLQKNNVSGYKKDWSST